MMYSVVTLFCFGMISYVLYRFCLVGYPDKGALI